MAKPKRGRGRPRKHPLPVEIVQEEPIQRKPLNAEQSAMMEAVIQILVEEVRLEEEQSIKIAEEYKNLSNLANAIRKGVDFGIQDDQKKAKMRLIGLSH